VKIDVYDVTGRHVSSIVDEDALPGWYAVAWEGQSDSGGHVASGVYFCRMTAPGFEGKQKLVLLK
jgi:hypothetical protein